MNDLEYQQRLNKLSKTIALAFVDAAQLTASRVDLQAVIDAVVANDIDKISKLTQMSKGSLTKVLEEIRGGFVQAGMLEAVSLNAFFDATNTAAEAWLASESSAMVVLATQNESARSAIKTLLSSGMARGDNPRRVALDIVGRINKATKRREGGVIGLYDEQINWVSNAKNELHNLDAAYFNRVARDKRFDAVVSKAIKDGKPLPAASIDAISDRYSDRLLKVRGDTIARTEAATAIAVGEEQARQQAIDDGVIDPRFAKKIWSSGGDSRERESHGKMNGQSKALDEPFVTPSGELLMHPCDSSLGASAKETINCRCRAITRIDYIGIQKARENG